MPYKVWTRERLSSVELQELIQDQVVTTHASASARAAAITTPTDGMVSYLLDVKRGDVYEDGGWQPAFYGTRQMEVGTWSDTTDGGGVATIIHGLGVIPTSVVATPAGGPVQHLAKLVVNARSSTQVQFVIYRTDNNTALAGNPAPFHWVVYR